jgi:SAM-dependent methyltransferase
MDESYRARYADLYTRHWWWRSREEFLERLLDRLVGSGGAGPILDFGCGDGLFFSKLIRYGEPWGIELDDSVLSPDGEWRSRIRSTLDPNDEAETGRYGLILALDVLEHIAEPRPIVRELRRRLRPGGLFIATVPAFQSMWTGHDVINHHIKRYRIRELEQLVREAGMEVSESRYFFIWLAFVKWAVAMTERLTHPEASPASVPSKPVNRLLLAVCRGEQRLVMNWRPPIGSSALVVGRAS